MRQYALITLAVVLVLAGCPMANTLLSPEDGAQSAPQVPTGLQTTTVTTTQVTLAWNAPNESVTSYELQRSVGGDIAFALLDTAPGTATSYADEGVQPGTTYSYRICAHNDAGASRFCQPVEVTTPSDTGDGSGTLEQFDFMRSGSYENVDDLGNGFVTLAYAEEPFDIETRIIDGEGDTTEWELHIRDGDGYVDIMLPEDRFSEGQNTIEARYVESATGERGDVGTLTIWRGYYGFGNDPTHPRIDTPQVAVENGVTAPDTLFWLRIQDPANPYEPIHSCYVMPADDGSLLIETTEWNQLLELAFYSPIYEYASVFMPDNPNFVWEIELREASGASILGNIKKDEGWGPEPIGIDDGAEAITLFRHHGDPEMDATIFAAPPILLSEEDGRFDRESGDFCFGGLAGNAEYGIDAIWAFDGQKRYWDVFAPAGEETELSAGVFDLAVPVILVEHNDYVVNHQDPLCEAMEAAVAENSEEFQGYDWIDVVALSREEIVEILNDPSHPLHERTWLVISADTLQAEVTELAFRDWQDFGLSATNYQPLWEGPDPTNPIMPIFPLVTGSVLVLYYNNDLIWESDVPTSVQELLALQHEIPPAGTTGWLAYPQDFAFWITPWLHGFGGSLADEDGSPTLNNDAMEETLDFLANDLAQVLIDDPGGDGVLDVNEANNAFLDGVAPMAIFGDWKRREFEGAIGTRLGMAPLPELGSPFVTGSVWPAPYSQTFGYHVVDRGRPAVEAAVAEVIMTTYTEVPIEEDYEIAYGEGFLISGASYPALLSAQDFPPSLDDLLTPYPEIIANTVPLPPIEESIWDAVGRYLPDVMSGSMEPTTAVQQMQLDAE